MELKDFVKKVILDLDSAIAEANQSTSREARFRGVSGQKNALEFDVAVTAESTEGGGVGGRVNVMGLLELGGDGAREYKNSTVSRVSFGIHISEKTKAEIARENAMIQNQFRDVPKNPAL